MEQKIRSIAWAIGHELQSPHIVAVQEICGDRSHAGDHRVPATQNADTLIQAIVRADGAEYKYIEVPPVNNRDGGAPNQNIRCGFLYRPDRVTLTQPADPLQTDAAPVASIESTHAIVLPHNPALIAPHDPAFEGFRKPLVAHFTDTKTDEHYYITNLHLPSNGRIMTPTRGISHDWTQGVTTDWKPDEARMKLRRDEATIIRDFQRQLLDAIHAKGLGDSHHVLCVGDFNTASKLVINGEDAPTASTEVLDIIGQSGLSNMADSLLKDQPSVGNANKNMTIDHFYVSGPLQSRIVEAVRPQYTQAPQSPSDHNPMVFSVAAPVRAASLQLRTPNHP